MEIFKLVFSPIEVNTYIIADSTGDCAIIDCGCYSDDEFRRLKEFLSDKGLTPVMLLNTHLHLDHIFGNRMVRNEFGLLTKASRLDEYNLKSAVSHAMMFGLSMEEPPEIGRPLEDGEIISLNDISIECRLVPGHTAGSLAFYIKEENCIFTGDALFSGSIGRTDLPGGDYETLMGSIRNRLLTLDDGVIIYPGHGPSSSIGAEKRTNRFLV
ncbi:MAG: MBL fold metallo-hydrolase [Bacteroidales bacterium]